MKKVFVLAAFAAVLAVSCQKNEAPVGEPAQIPIEKPAGIPMKLVASIGDVSKITYEPDGNVLKSNWEANETISVVTMNGSGQLVCVDNFTSTGAAGREKAEFSGTFSGGSSPAKVMVVYPALIDNGAGKYETVPYYDFGGIERSFLYGAEVGSLYIQGNSNTLKQTADNDVSHLKNYCILSGAPNIDDIKTNTINVTLSHEMIVLKVVATFPDSMKGKTLEAMEIDSFDSTDAVKGWSRSSSWEYLDIPNNPICGRGSGYNDDWSLYANIVIPDSGKVTLYFVNFTLNDMVAGDKLKFIATVDGAACNIATKTFTANKSFDKGKVYRMSVTLSYIPVGALQGKFTVNGSGDQVYFSKGNLQAETTDAGENWEWSFADHQYDCPGGTGTSSSCDNMRITADGKSSFASCTVGLFGWSTDDNTYFGISSSTTAADWDGNFVDWGEMAIGGAPANTWRTPKESEYNYLLNTRTTSTVCGTDNARFARATVNGVEGNILFPDAYTHPAGVADITNINVKNASNAGNTISASDWDKMEAAGAVFLPQAGYFETAYPTYVATGRGYYWTSTPNGSRTDTYLQQSSDVGTSYSSVRSDRHSVRLVHDVD